MAAALAINVVLLVAEVVGGILTGSLALLADAGHLASDVGSILLGLIAAGFAARPAGRRLTFGYQRSEVIAALVNGIALVAVAVLVAIAAVSRLGDPPDVAGGGVLALGIAGLIANAAATAILAGGERRDINLEGVLRHSAVDALGSIGVVVAGIVLLAGGPRETDAIVSLVIAALILASSWRLIKEPFDVIMEAAPADLDMSELERCFGEVPDVCSVHELHVWTVTAGFGALAAHVVVSQGADRDLARRRLELLLRERVAIDHTTLQMEEEVPDTLLELEQP